MTEWVRKLLPVWFTLFVVSIATTMSGMELFSALLLVSVAFCLVTDRPSGFRLTDLPFGAPVLALAVAIAASIAFSDAPAKEKLYDLGRLRFFLVFAALWVYLRFYAAGPTRWVRTLTFVCTVIGIYGFVQHFIPLDLVRPAGKKIIMYAIPDEKLGPLVLGTFNHHLTFASIYLFYACLFLAVAVYAIPRSAYRLLLSALLFLLCLWTQSRTAWIAVPIVVGMTLLPLSRRWSALAAGLVIALLAVFLVRDRGFVERYQRTLHSPVDAYTLAPRQRLWRLQWEMFKDSPVFGIGWNNNERHCREYFDRFYPAGTFPFCGHAHNNFLQVLSTTGLLGSLAFLWLWAAVLWRLLAAFRFAPAGSWERALAIGVFTGFVGFLIQGLTQFNFGDAEVTYNVMFFWAVAAALPVEQRMRAGVRLGSLSPSHSA